MRRINTTKWSEFRVGNLFDIKPTKAYKLTTAKLLDASRDYWLKHGVTDWGLVVDAK